MIAAKEIEGNTARRTKVHPPYIKANKLEELAAWISGWWLGY
jgi:hypothetical protein